VRCEFLRGCSGVFIGAGSRAPGDGRSKAAVMAFKAIKVRLCSGLKGIKGGVMGGRAVMANGIPRRGKGSAGRSGAVGRRGGEEGDDRWGPGVSGGERKGAPDGMREVKEKTYFAKYAIGARAERL
jgi:hypothetical protein